MQVSSEVPPEPLVDLYLKSLTAKEYRAYEIAKSHLGMSFDLEKSVGFVQWKRTTASSK